jgi:hypothetical protein
MKTLADAITYLEQGTWQEAHAIVQDEESALGCWLHGIVHLQEGDIGNARYWYARARRAFPAPLSIADEILAAKQHLS